MTPTQFFQYELDFSGTVKEVLDRIPDWVFDSLAKELDGEDQSSFLYFGLRRYAVEIGTPDVIEEMNLDTGAWIHSGAVKLLMLARMEREGKIIIDPWPTAPLLHPEQPFEVRATEKGKQHHEYLKGLAEAEAQRTANGDPKAK